jgi:primosomal protein N' (replication factor Y)
VCVLNRLGRSRLLTCRVCGTVAACDRCGAAVNQSDAGVLRCAACSTERPPVCAACGSGRFKNLRAGVARAREELEALAGEPVVEVTATAGDPTEARVAVGTEAVLHRLGAGSVGAVAFLDLDQELLAPRYRAAEQALALVARGARAVGGRAAGGRLLLQTRSPDHAVVRAALLGDPSRFAEPELERRRVLGYPPAAALALVSGAGAADWADAAEAPGPLPLGVELLGPAEDRWLVRAPDAGVLADWLATVPRPQKRVRIEVDPPRA